MPSFASSFCFLFATLLFASTFALAYPCEDRPNYGEQQSVLPVTKTSVFNVSCAIGCAKQMFLHLTTSGSGTDSNLNLFWVLVDGSQVPFQSGVSYLAETVTPPQVADSILIQNVAVFSVNYDIFYACSAADLPTKFMTKPLTK